jgi:hypothetical protein
MNILTLQKKHKPKEIIHSIDNNERSKRRGYAIVDTLNQKVREELKGLVDLD